MKQNNPDIAPVGAISETKAFVAAQFADTFGIEGQGVWLMEAITEPDAEEDEGLEGHVPMFRVVDAAGRSFTLLPEELRSERDDPEQLKTPAVILDGQPLSNLHPFVYRTVMANRSVPITVEYGD